MQKGILSILLVLMWTSCAYAVENCKHPYFGDIYNSCQPDKYDPNTDSTIEQHETFDWGAYGNLILWETENTEWGALATYAYDTNETRVYAGGKVYLNRLFWQKKTNSSDDFLTNIAN